jgi:glycerol-3-phosphate cytidylyltransferase
MSIYNINTVFQINEIQQKYKDKKIGFTAGVFDIFHTGYILMLQDSKLMCDILIVGLQDDPTIDRKEKSQPIQNYDERYIQLHSCKYVDEIIRYSTEEDLHNILKKLSPNIRIIGNEWTMKKYTGSELSIDIYWHEKFYKINNEELLLRIYKHIKNVKHITVG